MGSAHNKDTACRRAASASSAAGGDCGPLNTFASSSVVGALLWQASGCCLDYPGGCSPSWRSRRCTGCAESRRPLRLGGTPARALCSSSRYRISGASIFQSHKIASNTASGGPSHHAKISHGGCGFHSGLGRTLRAQISIPSLQDGSLGGAVRHSVNSTRRYFVPIRLFAAAT